MLVRLVVGALAIVAGLVIGTRPDRGSSIVSLGGEHGLSGHDFVAAALILGGWLLIAVDVWRRRARVISRVGPTERLAAAFAAGLGLGLFFPTFFGDWAWSWQLGVLVLVALQLATVALALRP